MKNLHSKPKVTISMQKTFQILTPTPSGNMVRLTKRNVQGRSWKYLLVVLRRAMRDRFEDLNRNPSASEQVEATLTDTNRQVGVVDNGDVGDLARPKSRKRRVSGTENEDTWISKKSKVSVPMREKECFTYSLYRREWTSVSRFMLGKKGQQWRYVWRSPSYKPSVDKRKEEKMKTH